MSFFVFFKSFFSNSIFKSNFFKSFFSFLVFLSSLVFVHCLKFKPLDSGLLLNKSHRCSNREAIDLMHHEIRGGVLNGC